MGTNIARTQMARQANPLLVDTLDLSRFAGTLGGRPLGYHRTRVIMVPMRAACMAFIVVVLGIIVVVLGIAVASGSARTEPRLGPPLSCAPPTEPADRAPLVVE